MHDLACFSPDSGETTFSQEKAYVWLKTLIYLFLTNSYLLHMTLIDGLEWCGLLVDYCGVFISCLDSHSDGTHSPQKDPLVSQFLEPVLMKKQNSSTPSRPDDVF